MADNTEKDPQDCEQLKTAIQKTGDNEKGRQQYLIKRSIELGCVEHIPDHWGVEVSG